MLYTIDNIVQKFFVLGFFVSSLILILIVFLEKDIEFPSSYPTSCLLGCVDVDEVLSQEDYRDKYPQGESSSPFVFVCSNPQELLLKFPMSGQHKICEICTSNMLIRWFIESSSI